MDIDPKECGCLSAFTSKIPGWESCVARSDGLSRASSGSQDCFIAVVFLPPSRDDARPPRNRRARVSVESRAHAKQWEEESSRTGAICKFLRKISDVLRG